MSDRETSPYRRIAELERENQLLREELEQQAICNGAGAERELALRSTIAELQRENLALRADKERLDWLESLAKDLICTGDGLGVTIGVASNFQNYATNAATFRSAIDAARKAKP